MPCRKQPDRPNRCPFEYGLNLFGGKWNARILCLLSLGESLRFTRLRDDLGCVTDAMLSAALRELLAEGAIHRRMFDEMPPRVEYSLTEKGRSILPLLQQICRWSELYCKVSDEQLLSPCRQCPHRRADAARTHP